MKWELLARFSGLAFRPVGTANEFKDSMGERRVQDSGFCTDFAMDKEPENWSAEEVARFFANPKGIPCLYLSTTANAAMSEVRPWIGSLVTVAQFALARDLTVVDCSPLHDKYFHLAFGRRQLFEAIPDNEIDEIVWARIDLAFAEGVTASDDTAEYAATQTIAELFRSEGYHGIQYKSAFGEDAFSVALFDLDAVALDVRRTRARPAAAPPLERTPAFVSAVREPDPV